METLDFIIVTSIFLDNAIEGAIQTQNPKITISFWEDHCSQLLSISNTISEEKTETKTIFERGVSNKGRERGIGLAKVTEILDNYINVNLETQSNNFSFTQQLTITKRPNSLFSIPKLEECYSLLLEAFFALRILLGNHLYNPSTHFHLRLVQERGYQVFQSY